MKKIIAALLLIMLLSSVSWAWEIGSGTEDDPYVIASPSDFSYFRYRVNNNLDDSGKYYRLSNDIQITSQTRQAPVGLNTSPFTGHFDGGHHTVYVKIYPLEEDDENLLLFDRALFGYVQADGYAVKDLHVAGYVGGYLAAGVVSRLFSGTIQGCTFSGDVEALTVTGDEDSEIHLIHAGGIVANMYGGEILSCDFRGNVTSKGENFFSYAGGIAGAMSGGSVSGSRVKRWSVITADGESDSECAKSAGGIAGYVEVEALDVNSDDATISGCTFEGGEVISAHTAGGIAGTVYGGIITDNTVGNDARITGTYSAGGISGWLRAGGTVSSNDVNGGIVQANSRASGGIIGQLGWGNVTDNTSLASVQGDALYIGGVIGEILNGDGTSENVGGNTYTGAKFGIGIDEQGTIQVDTGTVKKPVTLSFITPSVLPSASERTQYSCDIQLSIPVMLDLSPIPSWLNPSQKGGVISMSCIPPSAGEYEFTLTASYGEQTVSRTYYLTVDTKLMITDLASFPEYAEVGKVYSYTFTAYAGGEDISSLSWSVSGDIPDGLELDKSSGLLTGTPYEEGEYSFTVYAVAGDLKAEADLMLTVKVPISITSPQVLPSRSTTEYYYYKLETDSSDDIYWEITSGSLPEGLSLDAGTGIISGTPKSEGMSTFTVRASSGGLSDEKEFTIASRGNLLINEESQLKAGKAGEEYSQSFSLNEGTAEWYVLSGDVPPGLTLGVSTGILSGSPTMAGKYTFTVQAVSGNSSAVKIFTVNIALVISSSTLPNATAGVQYSTRLTALGAAADSLTWSISSDMVIPAASQDIMPAGLTLSADGVISGIPTETGTFTFSVYVSSSNEIKATKMVRITVDSTAIIPVTTTSLPNGKVSEDYSAELLSPSEGVTWSVSVNELPPGLMCSSMGLIYGVPTKAGDFTFTVRATRGSQSGMRKLTLKVLPADEQSKEESHDKPPASHSSSGGCVSGMGIFVPLLAGLLVFRKKQAP